MAATHTLEPLERGFRLGTWQVHPPSGTLQKGWPRRRSCHIEPKAMQVLLALAANAGRFVSKDALVQQVWNGRPVTDDCLSGAVRALRQALNDDPRAPRFIETRSNVGYRLIAEVRAAAAARARNRAALVAIALLTGVGVLLAYALRMPAPAPAEPRTIAVLPFLDLSGRPEYRHLPMAMTEGLILELAQSKQLRVISRTSVMAYADFQGPVRAIAEQLGANLLVEGSVQAMDGEVRVSVQLIDPLADEHLWAARFDRRFENLLSLQVEIGRVVAAQTGGVVANPPPMTVDLPPEDLHAYLQARYLLSRETIADVEASLAGFEALAELQPGFAPALLGQAEALLFLFKARARGVAGLEQGLEAALRFEAMAAASTESHLCIGQTVLLKDWNFAAAERRYLAAMALSPSSATARLRYAWLLVAQRRYDLAAAEIEQIRLLDPRYYDGAGMAMLLLYAGRIEQAIAEFERIEGLAGPHAANQRFLAMAYEAVGREADARLALVRMLEAAKLASADEVDRLRSLDREGLYHHLLDTPISASPIASAGFRSLLGDVDGALDDLERAVAERDPAVIYFDTRPDLANLRTHPRFQTLMADMGIIEAISTR